MSLPRQEARALAEALRLLRDLSSGAEKRIPTATRERARRVLRHYPLAADVRWIEGGRRAQPDARPAHPATMIGKRND